MSVLRYFDVVLVLVAAPIMLLIGVPASGYLVGVASWIILRAAGVAVERYSAAARDPRREVALRLGYLLGRLFALALAVVLVRRADGRDAGLAALVVIVFAFTIQLVLSVLTRPRSR
ncbi:MAG: hypothetical protein JO206_05530 [Solirubrobacterales bacterium]|nr:hypothetical protein [Solirubrobacterales bacterium]MBV9837289.1 hypothetical protein [Solirubrobacterales bacterium]